MGSNNNSDNNNNGNDDHDMLKSEDKLVKMALLIETITNKCASSSHPILEQINHAINSPDGSSKLEAVVISGGYTNYLQSFC